MPERALQNDQSALKIWDKIEIVAGEGRDQSVYVSRVEDIGNEQMTITKPDWVRGGKGLTFHAPVYVQFKKPDAMYRFSARIKPLQSKDSSLVIIYSFGKTERVQRRQFVRVNYHARLRYWLFKKPDGTIFDEEKWKESVTEDLSAGGALIRNNADDINNDDLVIVRIRQYDSMGIPPFIAARCCRAFKRGESSLAGMEFITLDRLKKYFSTEEIKKLPPHIQKFDLKVQNNLVRFIFEEQVKERQKGLI